MIELIIIIFIVGFVVFYLIRHPIRSIKIIGGTLGLFALGILGMLGFVVLMYGLLTLL